MIRGYTNIAPPVQFSADVGPSDALWPVTSTSGYPDPPFTLGAERGTANEEFVLCLDKASDSFTVDRGYDESSPAVHVAGTSIEHCSGAIDFREANAHVNDVTTHTTPCTSTTRPTTPGVGQRIYETNTGLYYTWTGLGNASTGWLPDAGQLLDYKFWASPSSLQFSDTAHGLGHDLPILPLQWIMPELPPQPFITGVPGTGVYYHRVKIEFYCRSLIFDSGSDREIMLASILPASPLSLSGSLAVGQVINTNAPWGAGYQNFCYVSAMLDNHRIPAGAAGAKTQLYSPTGRTAANAVYWDDPMWMAVTMV